MKDSRMVFGFVLLVVLFLLSAVVALGHVEKDSSYGLEFVLGGINVLVGGFAQWAFSRKDPS